jgi:hypothetical protein
MKNVNSIRRKAKKIRLTSKSINEVIENLKELFLEYGIKIAFHNYPSTFSIAVCNSHKAPIGYKTNWGKQKGDVPTSYPGFERRWSGNIEVVDKAKAKTVFSGNHPSFGDITDIVDFLCTGSGNSGDNFSIDGMLWLYDFPLINEEYNSEYNVQRVVISENYNLALDNFERKYHQAQIKEIKTNAMNIELDNQRRVLEQCLDTLKIAKQSNIEFAKNKFNSEYYQTLELPPNQFSVSDSTKQRCDLEYISMKEVHSDCLDSLNLSNKLLAEMEQLMIDSPELFI